jgi:hypothetical protein
LLSVMRTDTEAPAEAGPATTQIRPAFPLRPRVPLDGVALRRALTRRFRLPGVADPAPGQRRLVAVCAWAGALGVGGTVIALRLLVNLFQTEGGWYRPAITFIGAVGVVTTAAAFASIHRRRLPWMLLTAGTVTLLIAYVVTAAA